MNTMLDGHDRTVWSREAEPETSEFVIRHYARGTRKTQLPREGELWMEAAAACS